MMKLESPARTFSPPDGHPSEGEITLRPRLISCDEDATNAEGNSEVMTDEPPLSVTNKEDPEPKNRQSRDRNNPAEKSAIIKKREKPKKGATDTSKTSKNPLLVAPKLPKLATNKELRKKPTSLERKTKAMKGSAEEQTNRTANQKSTYKASTNGKKNNKIPNKSSVKTTGAKKKINTVSEAVKAILKGVSSHDIDENISSTPKTQVLDTLKKPDTCKPSNMSWLDEDSKPVRTCSPMEGQPPGTPEEDWDRPKSAVTHGSNTVIPVSPSKDEPSESPEDLCRAVEACRSKSQIEANNSKSTESVSTPKTQASDTLKKPDTGKPSNMSWLDEDSKPVRTCSSMEGQPPGTPEEDWDRPKSAVTHGSNTVIPINSNYTPSQTESVENPEQLWKAVEACRNKSQIEVSNSEVKGKSPEELWKAVEACRNKSQISVKDYSDAPLIPVQLPETSVRRATSSGGPFHLRPASRCKCSMSSASDGELTDSDVDGNNPESRASSVMSDVSCKEGPTPRPTSSRKLFFLKARPKSQMEEMPTSSFDDSADKSLISPTALEEDDVSSTSSKSNIKTPTFGQNPESPDGTRKPRRKFRLEATDVRKRRDCSPQRRKRPAPTESTSQPFAVGSEPFLVSSDANLTQHGFLPSIKSEYTKVEYSEVTRPSLRKMPSVQSSPHRAARRIKLKAEAYVSDNVYHIKILCPRAPIPSAKSTAMVKAVPTVYNSRGNATARAEPVDVQLTFKPLSKKKSASVTPLKAYMPSKGAKNVVRRKARKVDILEERAQQPAFDTRVEVPDKFKKREDTGIAPLPPIRGGMTNKRHNSGRNFGFYRY